MFKVVKIVIEFHKLIYVFIFAHWKQLFNSTSIVEFQLMYFLDMHWIRCITMYLIITLFGKSIEVDNVSIFKLL
jgi:hypothetical protein